MAEHDGGVGRRHVVLDEKRHHLAGVGVKPGSHLGHLRLPPGGADLAQAVAQVRLDGSDRGGGDGIAEAEHAGHHRRPEQLVGLGQGGGVTARRGGDQARRGRGLPIPSVDQQHPDPVVELADQTGGLFGDEPARLVGGRHGVVGGDEGHVVVRPIAQLYVPVAGVASRRPLG